MMRIAAVYEREIVNAHYRAVVPLRELERRGHTVLWPVNFTFEAVVEELPVCDALHIHRCMAAKDLDLVWRLRERRIAVVWDNDDDISEIPRIARRLQRLSRREMRRYFERSIEIAKSAHAMTTPSRRIAELYRDAGVEHVTVIENHVASEDVGRARRRHAGVVIGCTAGAEHVTDIDRLRIDRVLAAILRAHPGVRVVATGIDLAIRDPRYEHRPFVPVERLVEHQTQLDIGIAPILDTPFNRGRSNVKLKEYAAAGAMWLASPAGPYVGMGEEQGGLLVDDDAWHDTLTALLVDYRRRAELMERARAWARRESIRQAVRAWEKTFREAMHRARAR